MKRKYKITVAVTLLFFITVTSNTLPAFAEPDILSFEQAEQNIQECDNKIEKNMDKLNELKEEILEKENQLRDNKEILKIAQEKVYVRDTQLAKRLNAIQLSGGIEVTSMQYMEAIISSGNVMDALKKASLISQICESDRKLILDAKESRKKILDIKDNIDKEYKDLGKNKEEVENKIKELEDQKAKILKYVQDNKELLSGKTDITVPVTLPADITEDAKSVIEEAEKYLRVPYQWGGESPLGFDCSGFMKYILKSKGMDLPRTSEEQQKFAKAINITEIKPGDLVFNKASDSNHVGMYIGNDMYIQASHTGDVVKISRLSASNMKFAGRILQ